MFNLSIVMAIYNNGNTPTDTPFIESSPCGLSLTTLMHLVFRCLLIFAEKDPFALMNFVSNILYKSNTISCGSHQKLNDKHKSTTLFAYKQDILMNGLGWFIGGLFIKRDNDQLVLSFFKPPPAS